ncbi:NlpC/P60 family protein [Bacillus sp. SORGH_AS_0510]|uniref:C40 family peptidase n=1 Tax=Bacillus sp. SORGH_AS_0510 TaxID=3041771 RepID=UPI0027D87F6F|nr:C40 family peptidase [Bacillus sp. SORGH_AS_0510]
MILSIVIILTVSAGNPFLHSVYAESLTNLHNQNLQSQSQSTTPINSLTIAAEIPNLEANPNNVKEQMKRVYDAIQANNVEILKNENYGKLAKAEVEKLEKEMKTLEESMEKRKSVLKDRALSYQHTDMHVSYIDVLLGSTSFRDFVERVGAVAAIAEADRTLLEQQETEQQEYDTKKVALEKKLTEIANMKKNLETLKSHLIKQQNEYSLLKEQVKEEVSKKEVVKQTYINAIPAKQSDYISTVINAGKKYIGNSVYVFGGGRSTNDVARGRFDCSGFVHWAFAQAGVTIGTTTSAIKNDGRQVAAKDMQPGDLVFFDTYKKDGHVGIYIGDGKFIGSQSSTGVAIADMSQGYWKNAFKGRVVRI